MSDGTCIECGRSWDGGRARCHACRARDLCACGGAKHHQSTRCASCRSEVGEANGNWRGGRTRHKAGYVMVKTEGHPRGGKSGYVFEHILVVEEMLGRFLHSSETVHHRNGVKHDNRPENLELWTRPQPSGIRASDAVAWAKAILERYGDPGAPPTTLTDDEGL